MEVETTVDVPHLEFGCPPPVPLIAPQTIFPNPSVVMALVPLHALVLAMRSPSVPIINPLVVEVPATENKVVGAVVAIPKNPVACCCPKNLSVVEPIVIVWLNSGVDVPKPNFPKNVDVAVVDVATKLCPDTQLSEESPNASIAPAKVDVPE